MAFIVGIGNSASWLAAKRLRANNLIFSVSLLEEFLKIKTRTREPPEIFAPTQIHGAEHRRQSPVLASDHSARSGAEFPPVRAHRRPHSDRDPCVPPPPSQSQETHVPATALCRGSRE